MVSILWKAFEIWHSFQKYVGKKSLPEVWPPTVKTDTAFSNSSPRSTDQHPEERIYILLEYDRKMKVCILLNSTFGSIYILCFKLDKARLWCENICFKEEGKGNIFMCTTGTFFACCLDGLQQLERRRISLFSSHGSKLQAMLKM